MIEFWEYYRKSHGDDTTTLIVLLPCELKMRAMLVVRELRRRNLAPKIRCEEGICLGDLSCHEQTLKTSKFGHVQRQMLLLKSCPLLQSSPLIEYSNLEHRPAGEDASRRGLPQYPCRGVLE
jgi:hypothetical protein